MRKLSSPCQASTIDALVTGRSRRQKPLRADENYCSVTCARRFPDAIVKRSRARAETGIGY